MTKPPRLPRFVSVHGARPPWHVYLAIGGQALGFRQADAGAHLYYDVGPEHLAITVDTRQERVAVAARGHTPVCGT